jgi:hypothetical protein
MLQLKQAYPTYIIEKGAPPKKSNLPGDMTTWCFNWSQRKGPLSQQDKDQHRAFVAFTLLYNYDPLMSPLEFVTYPFRWFGSTILAILTDPREYLTLGDVFE